MAQSDDYEDSDEDDPGPSSSGRPCLGALPWRPVVLRPDGTVSAEGHSGKRGEGVREGPGRHGVTASVLPHATGGAAGAGVAEGAAEGASPGGRVWKVLRRAPYLVEFRVRARAFQDVVSKDRAMHQNNWVGPLGENRFVKVRGGRSRRRK